MATVQMGAQQQPAPSTSFRPSCVMCVSDCDGHAIFTSCHHFLCGRCAAKYPDGACPRCQKPCRTLPITAPNLADRVQGDSLRTVQQALQVADFQRRQDAITIARLKELVTMFNTQNRSAAAKVKELQAQNEALQRDCAALKAAQHQQQKHHDDHRRYPPSPAQYPEDWTGVRRGDPRGGGGRPPSVAGSDLQSLFGGANKRGRSPAAYAAHPAAHNNTMRDTPRVPQQQGGGAPGHHPQGGGDPDRFRLATPAFTLRDGGGGGGAAGASLQLDHHQHRPPQPRPRDAPLPPGATNTGGGSAGGHPDRQSSVLPPLRSMLPPGETIRIGGGDANGPASRRS